MIWMNKKPIKSLNEIFDPSSSSLLVTIYISNGWTLNPRMIRKDRDPILFLL